MENYSIIDDILTIKYDFNRDLDNEIKKLIVLNQVKNIKFYSGKYEILNQFNFSGSDIKSLIITLRDDTGVFYGININKPTINLDNLPIGLESLEITSHLMNLGLDVKMIQNLPPNLKKLKLYSCENISLENLPNTLETLDISCFSNQTNLLDYLPASLKSLNIKLTHVMKSVMVKNDSSVGYMQLGFNSLPSGLENLRIIGQYDGELNCLPIGLKILHLSSGYDKEIKIIPKNLQELRIPLDYKYIDNFKVCTGLKRIIIGFRNKNHCKNISNFNLKTIPESVEEIEFGDNFNQSLDYLPSNIKKITFGFNFCPFIINLTNSIEHLEFGYNFNGSIHKYPSNLKYLKFGRNFNQPINNLPEGLTSLLINERYNSVINKLPSTLEILEFDNFAEYNSDIICIPDSVNTIILGKYMGNNKINIPKYLKKITYPETNTFVTQQLESICFTGIINQIKKELL
jgi:hypothetical protein